MSRRWLCGLVVLVVWSAVDTTAWANNPRLNVILPRGVQRGTQHTLRFAGERLAEAQEVFWYDSGITVVEIKPVDANQIDVVVQVAPDCRLGEHVAQVRTARGISDYRTVFVGVWPTVEEVEPNTQWENRQSVPLNHTVVGTVTSEDVDYFVVSAKQGERISVEIEAIRLGYLFDPFLAILDDQRFELAVSDDTALFNQDAFVSIVAPADGHYTILVRETSYGGNGDCRYRLHVGNFPRPTAVYPAGGPLGATLPVTLLGDPTGPIAQTLTLPAAPGFRSGLYFESEQGPVPSPLPFRYNAWPNVLESEPNDTWVTEPVATLPAAFNGVIQTPGDKDFFLFEAKAGEVWEFDCFARRLGSGLDPVINIFKAADKSHVVGNDDSRGPDAYLRFTAPADGQYYVRIYDHLNRGQTDFVYRLEVTPVQPQLGITIPRIDRYSQQRQTIVVPRGNRFGTLFTGSRENIAGELQILQDNLPPGIKMIAPPMAANLNQVPVVFEAAADADLQGALVDLRVQVPGDAGNTIGNFSNLADFANGEPNNALYYGCGVNRLAMAVTQAAPFRITVKPPQAPLVRDGTYEVRVVVERDPGFDGPLNLQFPFLPPGVGTTNQIALPAGQTEIAYTLNANANAQLGKWPFLVIGYANVEGGPLWASSPLGELEIAEPFVKVEIPRAGCDQGQTAQLVAKFEQLTSFEGEGTLTVLGLPPNVAVEPVKFTKETTELILNLPTTDASPVGQHKSLFCQLSIPVAGEQVISATGRTELQINKPAPVVAAAPAPTPPPAAATEAAPPAPKPLSRLEQLREKFRNSGGTPPSPPPP